MSNLKEGLARKPHVPRYDLEERTLRFAKDIREFIAACPRSLANSEDFRQLLRSSGSVGANYIEANESLSKKDFIVRAKICRKEAKESAYWLKLLRIPIDHEEKRMSLFCEVIELTKIFSAIVKKSGG